MTDLLELLNFSERQLCIVILHLGEIGCMGRWRGRIAAVAVAVRTAVVAVLLTVAKVAVIGHGLRLGGGFELGYRTAHGFRCGAALHGQYDNDRNSKRDNVNQFLHSFSPYFQPFMGLL